MHLLVKRSTIASKAGIRTWTDTRKIADGTDLQTREKIQKELQEN